MIRTRRIVYYARTLKTKIVCGAIFLNKACVKKPFKQDHGFALIEVAIALCVLGFVGFSFLSVMRYAKQYKAREITMEHEERIFYALGNFMRQHGRLPCPADPEDDERWGLERLWCGSAEKSQGIVPFGTLGLAEEIARNGTKSLFAYVVHPNMANRRRLRTKVKQRDYCDRQISDGFIEILPSLTASAQEKGDPVVVILQSFGAGGEGGFLKGQRHRQPYLNLNRFRKQNLALDLSFYDPAQSPQDMGGERLRYETKGNLGSFYGKMICDDGASPMPKTSPIS